MALSLLLKLISLKFVSVSLPLSRIKSCCPKLNNAITFVIKNLESSKIMPITNLKAKLDCTYIDVWVNKIKIWAIVDTSAFINVISTFFAIRLGVAPRIDYRKEFGTAGLQSITSQGMCSTLPLKFGSLSVSAPAIVLPNQNYDFFIGS